MKSGPKILRKLARETFSRMDMVPTNPDTLRSSVSRPIRQRMASRGLDRETGFPSRKKRPAERRWEPKIAFTTSLLPEPTRPPRPRISPARRLKPRCSTMFLPGMREGTVRSSTRKTSRPTGSWTLGYIISILRPTMSSTTRAATT
jgi:hypothetical protein